MYELFRCYPCIILKILVRFVKVIISEIRIESQHPTASNSKASPIQRRLRTPQCFYWEVVSEGYLKNISFADLVNFKFYSKIEKGRSKFNVRFSNWIYILKFCFSQIKIAPKMVPQNGSNTASVIFSHSKSCVGYSLTLYLNSNVNSMDRIGH